MKRFSRILLILSIGLLPGIQAHAETIDVPGQQDCPGGNDGWRRDLEVNVTTHVEVTHCTRIEVVPVAPTPTPTPDSGSGGTPSTPAPTEYVSRVVGSDPYPSLSTGQEIPGTRVTSTSETSWPSFYENTVRAGWRCPSIYGPNGDPYAAESNGQDSSSGKWFRVCVKNPWREPIPASVTNNFAQQRSDAQAAALALSQEWNAAHPGQQKCFPWGPLTSPSGGTESGGVCANPVGASFASESSTAPTESATAATLLLVEPDPLPYLAAGQILAGTRVLGEKTIVCPNGSGSAIEVNATTKVSYTYCVKTWKPSYVSADAKLDSSTVSSAQVNPNTVDSTTVASQLAVQETTTVETGFVPGVVDLVTASTRATVVRINLESSATNVIVIATKKGAATVRKSVMTDAQGDKTLKISKNLVGYTVQILVNGFVVDKEKITSKK